MNIIEAGEEEDRTVSARLFGLRDAYEMRAVLPKERKIQKCRVRTHAFYRTLIIILSTPQMNYDRVMEIFPLSVRL